MTPTQIPPRGGGDWALSSLLKLDFINQLQCYRRKCTLVLKLGSKGLQLIGKNIFMQEGALFVFFFVDFCENLLEFPSLLSQTCKKQPTNISGMCPKAL